MNKNLIDKSLINNHRTNKLLCNCRNEEDYPMGGMCNSEKVVNQASIFPLENSKEVKGLYRNLSWKSET